MLGVVVSLMVMSSSCTQATGAAAPRSWTNLTDRVRERSLLRGESPTIGHQARHELGRRRPGEERRLATEVRLVIVSATLGEVGETRGGAALDQPDRLAATHHPCEDLRGQTEL